ncbi:hypothetical protein ACVFYP_27380 [Roseomonas sp. F4]
MFEDFAEGIGGRIIAALGMKQPGSWQELQRIVAANGTIFVSRARRLDRTASTGERAVLHALLAAVDYAALADELSDGRTWRGLDGLGLDCRLAVAAIVAQLPDHAVLEIAQ